MNNTTLNMTTLDGGVIIKKGGDGGATINNQDKVVDITENGTTEVVADGGYTGLGKVTINTEVSGGGDAPSGGGLSYFAIDTSIIGADAAFAYGSFLAKVVESSGSGILPTAMAVFSGIEEAMKGLKAIAIDENAKVYLSGQLLPLWGGLVSTVEEFISMGILTPITEEEFYTFE